MMGTNNQAVQRLRGGRLARELLPGGSVALCLLALAVTRAAPAGRERVYGPTTSSVILTFINRQWCGEHWRMSQAGWPDLPDSVALTGRCRHFDRRIGPYVDLEYAALPAAFMNGVSDNCNGNERTGDDCVDYFRDRSGARLVLPFSCITTVRRLPRTGCASVPAGNSAGSAVCGVSRHSFRCGIIE